MSELVNDNESFSLKKSQMEAEGLDPVLVNKGFDSLKEEFPAIYSLLVIKNGKLVFEKYNTGIYPFYKNIYSGLKKAQYRGMGKIFRFSDLSFRDVYDGKWNIRSVTKCVLSLLAGVAVDKGYIPSLDNRVIGYFPEYESQAAREKNNIRIRHLLSMKSGLESIEKRAMSISMIKSSDWIKFILNLNFESTPGEKFSFNTADSHLLSGVLSRASGMSTLELAQKYLFKPLNINSVYWENDPKGFHFGGSNLFMLPVDLAKIGLLVLNGGMAGNNRIISAEWINESMSKASIAEDGYSYGYCWRIGNIKSEKTGRNYQAYSGSGAGGQRLYIIPSLDIVMVTVGRLTFGFDRSFSIERFMEKYLLPSAEEK
ncbi:MAG TPA: serine hydrolase [Clostridiaceae bacterium]|nr:serine hydrolase [Clostridiaceae bacterium]